MRLSRLVGLLAGLGFVTLLAVATWQAIQANPAASRAAQPAMPVGQVPRPVKVGRNADLPLPARLAGLEAGQVQTGPQAVSDIAGLHGGGFDLVDGYVAYYGSGWDTAIVWVARAASAVAAKSMVEQMTARIAAGRSPFSRPEPRMVGNRTIYATRGQGQVHYYFQASDLIVWVAASADQAPRALDELLGTMR